MRVVISVLISRDRERIEVNSWEERSFLKPTTVSRRQIVAKAWIKPIETQSEANSSNTVCSVRIG